jgi:hypothetical protein
VILMGNRAAVVSHVALGTSLPKANALLVLAEVMPW